VNFTPVMTKHLVSGTQQQTLANELGVCCTAQAWRQVGRGGRGDLPACRCKVAGVKEELGIVARDPRGKPASVVVTAAAATLPFPMCRA
jgi:hypothetical protein